MSRGLGRHFRPDKRDRGFPMRAALPPRADAYAPDRRTWRLLRRQQLDQGNTPMCVAYTGKHWELALPTHTRTGLEPAELYRRCKQFDGNTQDGTDARSLMKVYQQLGKIGAYHWWTGDDEELKLWLLTKGPAWLGIYLSDEMWEEDPRTGLWGQGSPDESLGHEVCIIGYDRRKDEAQILNSWSLSWGDQGRARIRWADLRRFLEADGDCVGGVELAG